MTRIAPRAAHVCVLIDAIRSGVPSPPIRSHALSWKERRKDSDARRVESYARMRARRRDMVGLVVSVHGDERDRRVVG